MKDKIKNAVVDKTKGMSDGLFNFPQIDSKLTVWFLFEGKEYEAAQFSIAFGQSVDHKGQPQVEVRGGRIYINGALGKKTGERFALNTNLNAFAYKNPYFGVPYALTEIFYPGGFIQAVGDRADLEEERRKAMGRWYLPLSPKSFF